MPHGGGTERAPHPGVPRELCGSPRRFDREDAWRLVHVHGLTHAQAAQRLGVTRQAVSQGLRGYSPGVPVAALLELAERAETHRRPGLARLLRRLVRQHVAK